MTDHKHRDDERDDEQEGQVSEASALNPDAADTPISDGEAVAANPTGESGAADEGPAGPNADPHRGQRNEPWTEPPAERGDGPGD